MSQSSPPYDLIVAGTITLDTLHLPHGVYSDVPGGSALFGALGASLMGPCALVGTAGDDLPLHVDDALLGRHINVDALRREAGPTMRWTARYSDDFGGRETLDRQVGVGSSAPVVPAQLRVGFPTVFLGSMEPATQRSVLEQTGADLRYGIDTMTHWISGFRSDLLALVGGADTVFVSKDECILLGGGPDPNRAAVALLENGAAQVVVKGAAAGVLLFRAGCEPLHCPAVPVPAIVDPTGAGDALGGAFMAARARGSSATEALVRGVAAASIALEGVSCAGFSDPDVEFSTRTQWARGHITEAVDFPT